MSNPNQLAKENQQLQIAVNELSVLNDIATTISSIQPVEQIIDQIVIKCIQHLGVEEATVSLLNLNETNPEFLTMIRRHDTRSSRVPIKLDSRLTGWMLKNRSVLLSNNISEDDRFHFLDDASYSFKSILCVPLLVKNELIGYLAVFNKKNEQPFTEEDRRLISIIGSQSAQVIENARLLEEEKALISMKEEMRMAREIQLNLLPDEIPQLEGFELFALNIPAKEVGGDYFDFISLPSNRLGFCVGDITGKGMPAAMLMANLQATIRSQSMIFEDCSTCLKGTNRQLFKSTQSTKFATLFYGGLDPVTGNLEYANGGHDAPILFRDNQDPISLNATGLILGVMEDSEYRLANIQLEANDVLLLYTDGITEAMNLNDEEYGLERLTELVHKNRSHTAKRITDLILEDVLSHAGKASQSDDITLMILKKT